MDPHRYVAIWLVHTDTDPLKMDMLRLTDHVAGV
jgi:hypothetical protein